MTKAHQPPARSVTELKAIRNITVRFYVGHYFRGRDVTEHYSKLCFFRVRHFIGWLGRDIPISELTCDMVNEWLTFCSHMKLAKVTVNNYRRTMLMLMNFAYMEGAIDEPPTRLKRIKTQRQIIQSFSLKQIRKLVEVAKEMPDYFPNGVKRADFWAGIIGAAYSTGLRRGDLLAVKRSQIGANGVAQVIQSKTGHVVCVRFSSNSRALIHKMRDETDLRAFRWPYHENAMPRQFRYLLKVAGIDTGTFKWLRRSAGSQAEAQRPGDGPRLLGHRSLQVFRDHYEDQTVTKAKPVEPPELEITTEA